MNHTPGPWAIATKRNENNNTITIGIPYLCGGSLEHVSAVAYAAPQPHYKDNQEANARLIAAAPDLLDICRQIRFALFSGADLSENFECRCDDNEGGYICLGHALENAIKKAKG